MQQQAEKSMISINKMTKKKKVLKTISTENEGYVLTGDEHFYK